MEAKCHAMACCDLTSQLQALPFAFQASSDPHEESMLGRSEVLLKAASTQDSVSINTPRRVGGEGRGSKKPDRELNETQWEWL